MLEFNIRNQTITRTDSFDVVGDSKNYLKASFSFSDEWTGVITAVFDYDGRAYCVILPEDNTCFVPWEVIKPPYFTVSVFCGDLITANTVLVKVDKSGYCEGETPSEPTPDVYAQILQQLEEIKSTGGSGTSVKVDKTLSIEGAVADAKAVGDALGDVETALDHIIELQEQYKSYAVSTMSEGGDTE